MVDLVVYLLASLIVDLLVNGLVRLSDVGGAGFGLVRLAHADLS